MGFDSAAISLANDVTPGPFALLANAALSGAATRVRLAALEVGARSNALLANPVVKDLHAGTDWK